MERMIGYIKGKDKHELIIRRPNNLRVISFGDSSYGDCIDTRRSSSGDLHTIGGALISWRSQRLRMVCLSSTEAEYVTMTEMAKEQKFLQMLVEELTGKKEQGILYGDNEAAIFLSKNKQVSARTKHIDIKSHYIREHVNEGRALLRGVRTENNFADILTKNTSILGVFKKLSQAILRGFQGWEEQFKVVDRVNTITLTPKQKHNEESCNCHTHDQRQRENVQNYNQGKKKQRMKQTKITSFTNNDKNNIQNNNKSRKSRRAEYRGINEMHNHVWRAMARGKFHHHAQQQANTNTTKNTEKLRAPRTKIGFCSNQVHDKPRHEKEKSEIKFNQQKVKHLPTTLNIEMKKHTNMGSKHRDRKTEEYKMMLHLNKCQKGNKTSDVEQCKAKVENGRNGIKNNTREASTKLENDENAFFFQFIFH
jgi:hypothetical protein